MDEQTSASSPPMEMMPFSPLAVRVCLIGGVGEDLRGFDAAFARFGDYPPFRPRKVWSEWLTREVGLVSAGPISLVDARKRRRGVQNRGRFVGTLCQNGEQRFTRDNSTPSCPGVALSPLNVRGPTPEIFSNDCDSTPGADVLGGINGPIEGEGGA